MSNLDNLIMKLKNDISNEGLSNYILKLISKNLKKVNKLDKEHYYKVDLLNIDNNYIYKINLGSIFYTFRDNILMEIFLGIDDNKLFISEIQLKFSTWIDSSFRVYSSNLNDFNLLNEKFGKSDLLNDLNEFRVDVFNDEEVFKYIEKIILLREFIANNPLYMINTIAHSKGYTFDKINDNLYKLSNHSQLYYLHKCLESNALYISLSDTYTKDDSYRFHLIDFYNDKIETFFNNYLPLIHSKCVIKYIMSLTGYNYSQEHDLINLIIKYLRVENNSISYRINSNLQVKITGDRLDVVVRYENKVYQENLKINENDDLLKLKDNLIVMKQLMDNM